MVPRYLPEFMLDLVEAGNTVRTSRNSLHSCSIPSENILLNAFVEPYTTVLAEAPSALIDETLITADFFPALANLALNLGMK